MSHYKTKTSPGFTLVEILMVVAILGIASAMIIPQLGSRADLLAGSAARQIMSDITFAQNRAITTQTPTYVAFMAPPAAGPGGSYSLCTALPDTVLTHPVTKNPFTTPFGIRQSFPTIRLDNVSFDGRAGLMFDETGAPYSIPATGGTPTPLSAGEVRVTCQGITLTVRMEPLTGTLSVQ